MKADLNTAILIVGFIFVWLTNRHEVGELRHEISELRAYLGARVDRLADKLDEINKALGAHGAEISMLKEKKSA